MSNSELNIMRTRFPQFMHLRIFVDSNDNALLNMYENAARNHNAKILSPNTDHIDAGFDVFVPAEQICQKGTTNKVDFLLKCIATMQRNWLNGQQSSVQNTGYYMYPRSSVSKTPLRLANSVGIIDSGYRGHLMAMFDCNAAPGYLIGEHDRLVQICSPGLEPIYVEIVYDENTLGLTERGEGGFGSTGR